MDVKHFVTAADAVLAVKTVAAVVVVTAIAITLVPLDTISIM